MKESIPLWFSGMLVSHLDKHGALQRIETFIPQLWLGPNPFCLIYSQSCIWWLQNCINPAEGDTTGPGIFLMTLYTYFINKTFSWAVSSDSKERSWRNWQLWHEQKCQLSHSILLSNRRWGLALPRDRREMHFLCVFHTSSKDAGTELLAQFQRQVQEK